jgi:hypothetical protein
MPNKAQEIIDANAARAAEVARELVRLCVIPNADNLSHVIVPSPDGKGHALVLVATGEEFCSQLYAVFKIISAAADTRAETEVDIASATGKFKARRDAN